MYARTQAWLGARGGDCGGVGSSGSHTCSVLKVSGPFPKASKATSELTVAASTRAIWCIIRTKCLVSRSRVPAGQKKPPGDLKGAQALASFPRCPALCTRATMCTQAIRSEPEPCLCMNSSSWCTEASTGAYAVAPTGALAGHQKAGDFNDITIMIDGKQTSQHLRPSEKAPQTKESMPVWTRVTSGSTSGPAVLRGRRHFPHTLRSQRLDETSSLSEQCLHNRRVV